MAANTINNWQQHLKNWPHRIEHIRQNDKLADFKFIVGPAKIVFHAHKLIFALSSPEFENLFYLLGSEMREIDLPDISPEIFEAFINFIYTGVLRITSENVGELLRLSTIYLVTILSEKCKQFVKENIKIENVWKFLNLSCVYGLPELEPLCFKIIEENSDQIFESPEFMEISRSTLEKIIDLEILSCKAIKLFEAVDEWSVLQCEIKNKEITSYNKRFVIGDIILKIPFGEMSLEEFGKCASNNTPLTGLEIIKILQAIANPSSSSEFKLRKVKELVTPQTIANPARMFSLTRKQEASIFSPLRKFNRFVDGPLSTNFWYARSFVNISANKDIFLFGCGIFGRGKNQITIELTERSTGFTVAKHTQDISFDGSDNAHEIYFKFPALLEQRKIYEFMNCFGTANDTITKCGFNGKTEIEEDGVVLTLTKGNFKFGLSDSQTTSSVAYFLFKNVT